MTHRILVCYDGPKDAELAADTAATLLGPRAVVIGSCGPSGLRELARGSGSHDMASHVRRAVPIVPPVMT